MPDLSPWDPRHDLGADGLDALEPRPRRRPDPGKRTLTQFLAGRGPRFAQRPASSDSVSQTAQAGVAGSGGALPFLDQLAAAFGGVHELSTVRAHVGGPATDACDALGAEAYATGAQVAFRAAPDLHTVAHEATHVLQQRAGLQLDGGVGQAGDDHERHADAVADRVVAGASAADLLAPYASAGGTAGSSGLVQRKGPDSVVILGVRLTATAGAKEFGALEAQVGTARLAGLRGAAGKGGEEILRWFAVHGVTIETAKLAIARAVADAYARWVTVDKSASARRGRGETTKLGAAQKGSSFDGVRQQIEGWSADVELGQYVEATLDASIPVPEVPGLTIDVGGELTFTRFADGNLKLEASIYNGATWDIFKLLNVSVKRSATLELEGDNLGWAFVDCLKQTFATIVRMMGVEAELKNLRRIAADGPSWRDFLVRAPEVGVAALGGQHVIALVDAYFAFFKNDASSGFKISVGRETTLGALDNQVTLGLEVGIKDDKDNTGDAMAYAELNGSLQLGADPYLLKVSGSAHLDGDGAEFKLGVKLTVPWAGGPLIDAAVALGSSPTFRACLGGVVKDGAAPERETQRGALQAFGDGALVAAQAIFFKLAGVESKVSLEVEYTWDKTGLAAVKATAKTITELEVDAEVTKGKLAKGTVLDVTVAFEDAGRNAVALRTASPDRSTTGTTGTF